MIQEKRYPEYITKSVSMYDYSKVIEEETGPKEVWRIVRKDYEFCESMGKRRDGTWGCYLDLLMAI